MMEDPQEFREATPLELSSQQRAVVDALQRNDTERYPPQPLVPRRPLRHRQPLIAEHYERRSLGIT